jgi:hypothetical protein
MRVWSGFKRFRICTSGRLSRKAWYDNETSGSTEGKKFLDELNNC